MPHFQALRILALAFASLNPFASPARVHVLVFARTDCPITNRYAPELRRIASEFHSQGVDFWMVYPDRHESDGDIGKQMADYRFPGKWVRDPKRELVTRAHATTAPEAAVFDHDGKLVYHGRIDDQWVDFGRARSAPTEHDLEDAIAAALAGKASPHSETKAVGCSLADVE